MNTYIINKNEMLSFLRYKIISKWKIAAEDNSDNTKFSDYLMNETSYSPDSEFIQSFCRTREEHKHPYETGIYDMILPADVARYELKNLYKPQK